MLKFFFAALVGAALLAPAPVDAYGAYHVGYTHVGPTGVHHYGATALHTATAAARPITPDTAARPTAATTTPAAQRPAAAITTPM